MVDLTHSLRQGTPFVLGVFMLGGLSGIGVYGVWPLLPPALAFGVYAALWKLDIGRQRRPEYLWAAVIFFGEAMMALSLLLNRGPLGYTMAVIAMPVLLAALIFPRRVAIAATVAGMVLLAALLWFADANEVRHIPAAACVSLFVLASLAVTAFVIRDLDDATRRSAFVDELTGALNRAALTPKLAELAHRAGKVTEPVSVIVADVDHFKHINDEFGHGRGDWVLREIARRLGDCVTATEPLYRLGGEEFVILLPGASNIAARDVALRMCGAVRESPVDGLSVTMSFGVATALVAGSLDFDAAFARADHALYAAKRGGRDRVATAADAEDQALAPVPGVVRPSAEDTWCNAEQAPSQRRRRLLRVAAHTRGDPATAGWTLGGITDLGSNGSVTDELEREFVLDLNRRLSKLFRVIAVGALVVIATGIPSFGWHTLIAPALGALPYYLLSRMAHRFQDPSRALVTGWALFQTSIAIGFACSHGAPLFALSFFVLMVPGRCAVFRSARAAVLGTAYTALLMTAVAFWLDATRVIDNPAILLLPLGLLCEAGYVGTIVGRSTLAFRGAGIVDQLTGLLNRTALSTRLIELETQTTTVSRRVAVLLADLDHFKMVNDSAGHAAGDSVLRAVAGRIHDSLRNFDSAYRVGGEEFLVLLTDADLAAAGEVAERLRQAVRSAPCGGQEVTISLGVAATVPGQRFRYNEAFERADRALYEAKNGGRDRVCAQSAPKAATALAVAAAAA